MAIPYISKVRIRNYRNFLDTEVNLSQKQVIIGENNVGKTNFIRAIQLILDRSFSDTDRQLQASDFHDSLDSPMENGQHIEITIQIRGYDHNRKLVAEFTNAVISTQPPTLQITYRYYPLRDEQRRITGYSYKLFMGNSEDYEFKSSHRNWINIYVIKALRDVERELKANKYSPLYKLVQQYEIAKEKLEEISEAMQSAADEVLELDEITHIKKILQQRFNTLSGLQHDYDISLRTFDVDVERLLYSLQVYMGIKQRPVSEMSLGMANILYVSLLLILLKDRTVPPIMSQEVYNLVIQRDTQGLLNNYYSQTESGNYRLRRFTSSLPQEKIYEFMDENYFKSQSFTILAVEEPEAHLHPILQRLIYREVLHKSANSVIFTSHSPHIASVAPIDAIVHLQSNGGNTRVTSTATLTLDARDKNDLHRYLDVRRAELYFGKGVVLIEGVAEEYIVPAAATLLATPFEDYGIVVCNINSANFKPYAQLLTALDIPFVVIADGDYYEIEEITDAKGRKKETRKYHILSTKSGSDCGYRGNEIAADILIELNLIDDADIPEGFTDQDKLFAAHGIFIGHYTLEVDILEKSPVAVDKFKTIYSELILGGDLMQENFETDVDNGDYWAALKKIESNIGKGRFAQRLAGNLSKDLIPTYIQEAIKSVVNQIKSIHE